MPVRYDLFRPAIDHVIPRQHAGASDAGNLALSCAHCNGHKGPNLSGLDPVTGTLTRLYNPRLDRWEDHFAWDGAHLVGLTAEGRVTIHVMSMNSPERIGLREALILEGRL